MITGERQRRECLQEIKCMEHLFRNYFLAISGILNRIWDESSESLESAVCQFRLETDESHVIRKIGSISPDVYLT